MFLGIIYAILCSILLSAYSIARKFTKQNAIAYTVWIGIAFFITTAIIYGVVVLAGWGVDEPLISPWHLLSLLLGMVWVFASACVSFAVDKIGLSKSTQWKNLQGPIAAILMLAFLSDVVGSKIWLVLCGFIVMFISAMLFNINKNQTKEVNKNAWQGVLLSVLGAVGFGVYAFLQKILTNNGFVLTPILYASLAVALFSLFIYVVRYRKIKDLFTINESVLVNPFLSKQNAIGTGQNNMNVVANKKLSLFKQMSPPIIAGVLTSAVVILNMLSFREIAGSVAFGIIQANVIWTILVGILVFREINFRQNWLRITCGFISAIGAVVLLIFSL